MANNNTDKEVQSTTGDAGAGNSAASTSQSSTYEVVRVDVKQPLFCKDEPDIYFIEMESQFTVAGIKTGDTKYHHVISSLEPQYLSQIADIIRHPPTEAKYDAVKRALIAEYTDSDQRKLRKLIREIELGDFKPSQLLKRMKELAGEKITSDALKSLWMERLPAAVRSIISIVDGDSTKMLEQADKMMEMQNFSTVAAVHSNASLQEQIEQLRKELEELRSTGQQRSAHQQDKGRPRSRNRSPYRQNTKPKVRFPFYTGADFSVVAPTRRDTPQAGHLYAANGTPIKTYGMKIVSVDTTLD